MFEEVKNRIIDKHQGDQSQLDFIFSDSQKIIVEAPAGYGKTDTMVSKIAYMLASQQIPNPKKLLALSFSVNAAYKVKKELYQKVPELLKGTRLNVDISSKIFVSNYHGFCKNILKKYGYKLHGALIDIDKLQPVDFTDSSTKESMKLFNFSDHTVEIMSNYDFIFKSKSEKVLEIDFNFDQYNELVINKLLPNRVISYNAILTLVIKLFNDYPKILKFYQKYFVAMFIDEYQDTNALGYKLICSLINDEFRVIFLGDPLQRIFGFIGAVPNLFSITEQEYNLTKFQLNKNYRFASNTKMLQLDSDIRRNAENPLLTSVDFSKTIECHIFPDQKTEALRIVRKSIKIISEDSLATVAILVNRRSKNIEHIINEYEEQNIPYFYCLFTDQDSRYTQFHRSCLNELIELIKDKDIISKKIGINHINKIRKIYEDKIDAVISALIRLLEIFWNKALPEFSSLPYEEKVVLIKEVFEKNGLKDYIKFIDVNIIISTVHAAKGLEWDYVILPDMEQDLFPSYGGICKDCKCKSDCNLIVTEENRHEFLEVLSVFYVAVTRARKQVYFTASQTQLTKYNPKSKNVSCLLKKRN